MIGVAMNTDEYVPATTPMSIVSAKSKIEPSPNANSARTAKNVVTDVMTVRPRQALIALLQSSANVMRRSWRSCSRMRSNTTTVSFTE